MMIFLFLLIFAIGIAVGYLQRERISAVVENWRDRFGPDDLDDE